VIAKDDKKSQGGYFEVIPSNLNEPEFTVSENRHGDTVVAFTDYQGLEVNVYEQLSAKGFNLLAEVLNDKTLDHPVGRCWTS
jgi:hypothetical protein